VKARINGLDLAYTDQGQGTPVVFLHAFPFNRAMWEPQLALADHHRVITIDLRSHGESDAGQRIPILMDLFAEDVIALLDHLTIRQAVFVGLSMGGYLIFSLYRRAPARAQGLVLADTRADADALERKSWRVQLAQRVAKEGAKAVVEEMLPKLLAPSTYQDKPALVETIRSMMLSAPVSGIVGDLMAIKDRPDSVTLLKSITCPTLVLVGEQDALTGVAENRLIAESIPGARFEVIPSAGHMSNLEQPEAFNAAVRSFLETLREGRR
jgi:pimeloyl-ACP methyl ester carboxylesterase